MVPYTTIGYFLGALEGDLLSRSAQGSGTTQQPACFHRPGSSAAGDVQAFLCWMQYVHSRKLTWKPKKGPVKTTVLLKGGYVGFHVSLGECI